MTQAPRLLGGRYEVGELIGRGGMAEVHLGHDTRLGRPVAIKMLRSDLARDSTFLTRFRREAKSAAGLNHHAIVAVYDSGEETYTETGGAEIDVPYIVMEYVDGDTLRDVLNAEGHLSPDEAARITQGILSALEYSHSRGIVHRDIKPANVMLTRGGQVKVMDFGIARALADVGATMTSAQAVVGTARYLSPEQAKGDQVDERSDLYSAGCVLYELLCGRTPFVGEPVSLVYQHISDRPAPPSSYEPTVPKPMDAVAMHSLEKPREGRYQTAGDFRADLQNARTNTPVSAAATASLAAAGGAAAAAAKAPAPVEQPRRDSTREIADRGRRPNHVGLWTAAVIAALLAILGVGYLVMNGQDETKLASVPSVRGFTEQAADQTLRNAGFVPSFRKVTSDATLDTVVAQRPNGGEPAESGSTVTVDLSGGPNVRTVPSVVGKTEQEARKILGDNGFDKVAVDPTRVDDTEYAEGQVTSTDPIENSAAPPTQTITLKLSSGKVTVPSNLEGMNFFAAQQALAKAHLQPADPPTSVPTSNSDLWDKVQDVPDAGKKVAVNSRIAISVYTRSSTVTVNPPPPPPTTTTSSTSSPTSSPTSTPSSTSSPTSSPSPTSTAPPSPTSTPPKPSTPSTPQTPPNR
ncbi:Stk1 family PASTA domain-containing Ser/Thr kinase [Yimella sp. RIT 621]|uniref:Stk1 family PASTA domain-containing Ser/Thr kinase n=1 Tax=Yimella sp. RIT 621 TaxID=2510323 RepID=UPI00101B722C|nr:Stk1 family PASTA domain-containing Ser/Thr kinase [Yimella sp. RIT 621]RYG76518.1 Stk1 family PASTA domain-containing Ser/Thr kinase [Yimella sp. RIT 621]